MSKALGSVGPPDPERSRWSTKESFPERFPAPVSCVMLPLAAEIVAATFPVIRAPSVGTIQSIFIAGRRAARSRCRRE